MHDCEHDTDAEFNRLWLGVGLELGFDGAYVGNGDGHTADGRGPRAAVGLDGCLAGFPEGCEIGSAMGTVVEFLRLVGIVGLEEGLGEGLGDGRVVGCVVGPADGVLDGNSATMLIPTPQN